MKLSGKNKTVKLLIIVISSLVIASCSTKKKNFINRGYHKTTAKYNGYFNGKESLKAGIKKLKENHKDDFSQIIPVFKTGELVKKQTIHPYMNKAIEKGSIVIQKVQCFIPKFQFHFFSFQNSFEKKC